jgi:hypothetical protein
MTQSNPAQPNPEHTEEPSSGHGLFWLALISIGLTITLVGGLVGYANRVRLLTVLHLSSGAKAKTSTELKFADREAIVKDVELNATYDVPYIITNHEGADASYSVEVWLKDTTTTSADNMREVDSGTVNLGNGQSITRTATFSLTEPNKTYFLIIKLVGKDQEISVPLST